MHLCTPLGYVRAMSDTTPDDDLRYLRHVLAEVRLSAGGLAKLAGVAGSTLTRRLNEAEYKFVLSMPTIKKIEDASGISYARFVAGVLPPADDRPTASEDRPHTRGQIVRSVTPNAILMDRLMPVFSGAQGGNGKLIISLEPVEHVKLPAFLENVVGAYGLLIDGESMVPAFNPGDTALVNPNLRPQRGRNVILYHTPPDGREAEAIIKQLNGWNDREWDLEQWNPALKFKEFRKEWPICHRVVGKYDAS